MMDALAEAIKLDPVALRLKNIPLYSQSREGNPPYTTTGLKECLEEGARAFGWEEARKHAAESKKGGPLRRGVGMASAMWAAGGGGPPSTVVVKLFADGSINLNMGASDIGTGTKTVMAMVVSEELGVPLHKIQIEHADTGTTQFATPSGGSKTIPTESPTVRAAALEVRRQLFELASKDLKVDPSDLTARDGEVISKTDPSKKIKISGLSDFRRRGVLLGVGYRGPNPAGKAVNPFAAQFCEVEVNMQTGEVRIVRFLGTNDSGRVMNRLTFDNQVIGGITWGIGLAMTEARILDTRQTGKMVNRNWHDYKLPTALDMPVKMESLPIDREDPEANTAGAKGLGEPVTIPTAAAIANAIYNATGIRVTKTPINPMTLSQRLAGRRKEG
jgi:xanthine dehydrogenase YagR molybdenum-binding subunit